MNHQQALNVFINWDRKGRYVFTFGDLKKLFPRDNPKTLQEGINRLVKQNLLERANRGIYIFTLSSCKKSYIIEEIAKTMRRGEYNYISLESALSEYGAISQILIDRVTIMTTGRQGEYLTPYGTIEFTHTKRHIKDILDGIVDVGRPLRLATVKTAWRDLKRVGRNKDLVNLREHIQ